MASITTQADQTTAYITQQLRAGVSSQDVVGALVRNGWTKGDAESAVSGAALSVGRMPVQQMDEPYRPRTGGYAPQAGGMSAARSAALKQIIIGGFFCIGGIAVTVITYAAAANGGTYVVAWGAVIFGGIRMIRGIIGFIGG